MASDTVEQAYIRSDSVFFNSNTVDISNLSGVMKVNHPNAYNKFSITIWAPRHYPLEHVVDTVIDSSEILWSGSVILYFDSVVYEGELDPDLFSVVFNENGSYLNFEQLEFQISIDTNEFPMDTISVTYESDGGIITDPDLFIVMSDEQLKKETKDIKIFSLPQQHLTIIELIGYNSNELISDVVIYDLNGRVVSGFDSEIFEHTVNIKNYGIKPTIYILEITIGNSKYFKKFSL